MSPDAVALTTCGIFSTSLVWVFLVLTSIFLPPPVKSAFGMRIREGLLIAASIVLLVGVIAAYVFPPQG